MYSFLQLALSYHFVTLNKIPQEKGGNGHLIEIKVIYFPHPIGDKSQTQGLEQKLQIEDS